MLSHIRIALHDIRQSLEAWNIWMTMGWTDIQQRYRRSALGPWWLTISTGLMVAIVGPLYGKLFGQDIATFYPFLACGIVTWNLIASMLNEGCVSFIASEAYIKELRLPLPVYIMRTIWRCLIIFGHNLIVLLPLLLFFGKLEGVLSLLWIPGILVIALNGVFISLTLAILCARFRDVPQIVLNLVQVGMFVSPIMWPSKALGPYEWVSHFNPMHHFIAVVRQPLLGEAVATQSWLVIAALTLCNFLLALLLLARFRLRVAYWL